MIPISKASIFVEKGEGQVLTVLVAPQTRQVAVLYVAPFRRCVRSHTLSAQGQ
jgi:hypothetical protein